MLKKVAENLAKKPIQAIAITGGKGGVGKTNISVKLSIALAELQQKVLLLDADLGLANIDVLLNVNSTKNINNIVNHSSSLEEIIIDGPKGIKIVPAASGIQNLTKLTAAEQYGLIRAFNDINFNVDKLLIDTAAGITDDVLIFIQAAHEVILIVCDEPTSITDSYALIKVLHNRYHQKNFHIISNMVKSFVEGHDLYTKLNHTTERFLNLSLNFLGSIPFDDLLRKAVRKQQAVVEAFPNSHSAIAFNQIAQRICCWPVNQRVTGHISFFIEHMMTTINTAEEVM